MLRHAPVVRVSAPNGLGVDDLRAALASVSRAAPPRADSGLFRMAVDRVFFV